jgi:hypothetical protein
MKKPIKLTNWWKIFLGRTDRLHNQCAAKKFTYKQKSAKINLDVCLHLQEIILRRGVVKREIVLLMSIIVLSAAGCQKKEEPAKAAALSKQATSAPMAVS